MRRYISLALLVSILSILLGCVSARKGPAYGQEQEFKRQLAFYTPGTGNTPGVEITVIVPEK